MTTVPPNDPEAYGQALGSLYEALALGGVGAISQTTRDTELRALRALVQRYPQHARHLLAQLEETDPPETAP